MLYILCTLYIIMIIMCNVYNISSTGHPGYGVLFESVQLQPDFSVGML